MSCIRMMLILCVAIGTWILPTPPAHANKSGMSPQVLSLPSGPGSLGGIGENVQANLNMGLMSYSIKILVPQGRGTATPNPSVTYSSSAGAGLMGIGWSFSAGSSIERGTVRGLPTYTNADIFFAGGELVKIPASPFYRSRYEGAFMRHRWVQKDASDQQGYWIVESPDGSKLYYGANAKGEIDLNAQVYGLEGTYCWKLVTMVDRNGNRVEYSYFKDGTQSYMDSIAWVFDKSNKPLYQLKFNYEERPDHISDGKPGFDLKTTKRIKEVRITSDGTRFRSYHFDFEDSTGLSRLIKVTRYGRDATKAYPVAFTMKYSDAVFSPENSKMVTMPTSLGVDFRSGNIDFLDINGDGLPDVVDTSKPKHLFFINEVTLKDDIKQDGHDFPKGLIKENLKETSAQLSNPSIQMLDYNGDGFTDMVDAVNKKIYINKGNSQWEDSSTSLQTFPVTGKDPNMRFMDYDGDKKIDVLSSDGATTTFWVSDGKGNWVVTPGKVNIGLGFEKDKLRLIDINGDGLQDIVHITKNSLRYRKYLGYGEWTDWIDVKVPGIDQYELSTQAQFDDINGDGMADMVAFLGNSIVYFVNKNGVEFEAGKKLETFKGVDLPDSSKMTIRIVDVNGNGSRDIVWIDSSGKVVYLELFGKRPNLMTEISNGIGQRINVEYGSSVNFYLRDKVCQVGVDKACEGPWQNKMPMPFTVVTKITTWASRSDKPLEQAAPTAEERPQIQYVFYHNGFYDGVEKTFRGFRKVETLYDGDTSVKARKDTLSFDVGDTDAYRHGRLLTQQIADDEGHIYQQSRTEWGDCAVDVGKADAGALVPPIRFICRKSQEIQHIEGEQDAAKWKSTRTELVYDGFGNVTQLRVLGDVDAKGDEKYTQTTYITPSDASGENAIWNLRSPATILRCDAPPEGNDDCAETQHFYDGESFKGLPLGQLRKGNVTRVRLRVQRGEDSWIEPMRRKHDEYGNLVGYLDLSGQLRTVEWDAQFSRFPTRESIQLKDVLLSASTEWDFSLNKVSKSTDYNGHHYLYGYDSFGRMVSMSNPEDPQGKPSIRYTYELEAPLSRIIVEKRSLASGEYDRKQIQCYDGLGRKLSTRQKLDDRRYLVGSHTEFNRLGQRAQVWDSYEDTEACRFVAPSGTGTTQFSYDGIGRQIQVTYQDLRVARMVYGPFFKKIYDSADQTSTSPHFDTPTTLWMDGLERTIREEKMLAKGKLITTTFRYTAVNPQQQDRILSVTLSDGSEKKHEYDLLGNVTRVVDPDRSETQYIYNQQNLLSERIDAQGRVLLWGYDELGRPQTLQEKDKPETRITSTYDIAQPEFTAATHLKGKLARITYPGGMYLFSYDQKGQPHLERHVMMGMTLDIKRTFDTSGKVLSRTYPDGTKVDFQRDGAGRILSIPGILKEVVYDPQGTTQSVLLANGIRTSYSYNVRRWLTGIDVADGAVFRLGYTFDDVGNIVKSEQQHGSARYHNTYAYDALYRLTQATVGVAQEGITYQQNDLHNILSRSSNLGAVSPVHLGAHQYHETKIHALTDAGGVKLSYDRAGYLSQKNAHTVHWDGHGRLQRVEVEGKTIAQHWYGTQRKRLIKEEHGVHSFYVDDLFEIRDGVGVSYIKLGPNRIMSRRSPAIAATFFDDLAPASGDKSLSAKPDGQILASDAWLYHAAQAGLVTIAVKKRPLPLSLTRDMLRASLSRMLDGDKPITRYHHVDHLGNILATTDEKGAVIARTAYYPYGAIRQSSGPLPTYAYMGAELDQATQTYRFSQRSMDIKLGRWWSPDPAFDQIYSTDDEFNSYGMLRNNPIRMREFMGRSSALSIAGNGIVDAYNDTASFLSSEQFSTISDWGLVGISTAGALFAAYNAMTGNRARPSDGSGLKASRRLKKIGNALSTLSWSLWGATAGARLAGGSDAFVNTLNLAMLSFATMAESFTTIGLITEQKSKGRSTFKGRKSLIASRALVTLAMAASLASSAFGQATDNDVAKSAGSILAVATSLISILGNEKIVNKVALRIKQKKALKDVASRVGNAIKATKARHPNFKPGGR